MSHNFSYGPDGPYGGNVYPMTQPRTFQLPHGTGHYNGNYYGDYKRLFQLGSGGSCGVVFELYIKYDVNYTSQNTHINGYIGQWGQSVTHYQAHCDTYGLDDQGTANRFAFDSNRNVYFHNNAQWESYAYLTIKRMWGTVDLSVMTGLAYQNNSAGLTYHATNVNREAAWGT